MPAFLLLRVGVILVDTPRRGVPPIGIILYFSKGPIGAGFKVFLEARRNVTPTRNEMVQTQWQQTLRRKIGLSGPFCRITYTDHGDAVDEAGFPQIQLGYRWRLPGRSSVFIPAAAGVLQ